METIREVQCCSQNRFLRIDIKTNSFTQTMRLVPNDTVTKRTKKAPILLCTFLNQHLDQNKIKLAHYIHPPFKNIVVRFKKIQMLMEKRPPPFCQFFGLVTTLQKYSSLCRDLVFSFILVHTQVNWVGNYYIIIYTMKNNHFIWMSVFNCLIGILYF